MLVITLGDPLSVTVEVLGDLLADGERARSTPIVLVGSAWQWRDQSQRLGRLGPAVVQVADAQAVQAPGLYLIDIGRPEDAAPAEQLAESVRGALARRALEWLRGLTGHRPLAVVTGPIDKHACALAGYEYPGQTEFFENLWGSDAVMTLAGPRLRVGLATNHMALRDVPLKLTRELVVRKLELFIATLRDAFAIATPRIAVCGLNPHTSDQGLFGDEEERIIVPAIAALREGTLGAAMVAGPLPADTAFYRCYQGIFDGVLAMYHDQGLGPLKTVHFDDAINLSGGLPHLRASPDHGPAQDLFLKRRASPVSFAAAIDLALRYLASRPEEEES